MAVSKLRLRILEAGVKQYILAAVCEIAPGRISEYVLLKRPIAAHHLPKLCGALGAQPEDIVGAASEDELIGMGLVETRGDRMRDAERAAADAG